MFFFFFFNNRVYSTLKIYLIEKFQNNIISYTYVSLKCNKDLNKYNNYKIWVGLGFQVILRVGIWIAVLYGVWTGVNWRFGYLSLSQGWI